MVGHVGMSGKTRRHPAMCPSRTGTRGGLFAEECELVASASVRAWPLIMTAAWVVIASVLARA
jgi:hypothetical protein